MEKQSANKVFGLNHRETLQKGLRHFDIEYGKVRLVVGNRLQRGLSVGIDAGDEAFRLQGDRHAGQDVAIVIDERDHMAHAGGIADPVA